MPVFKRNPLKNRQKPVEVSTEFVSLTGLAPLAARPDGQRAVRFAY